MEHHVDPGECCLVIGIPVCRAWTESALAARAPGSFMEGCVRALGTADPLPFWERYRRTVASPVWKAMVEARGAGARVTIGSRRAVEDALFRYRVVMLVAHRLEKGFVELPDGPLGVADLASDLPSRGEGVLDLASCYAEESIGRLQRERPDWHFRWCTEVLSPPYHVTLFARAMYLLSRHGPALYTDVIQVEDDCMKIPLIRGHNVNGRITYLGKDATGRLTQGAEPKTTSLAPLNLQILHLYPGKELSFARAWSADSSTLIPAVRRSREVGGVVPTVQPVATSPTNAPLGWAPTSGDAGEDEECRAPSIIVSREPSGDYHVRFGTFDLRTTSPAAAQEAVATLNVVGKSKELTVRFRGFLADDMRLFLRPLEQRSNTLPKAILAADVEPQEFLADEFDLRRASKPRVRVIENGDGTTTVRAEIALKRRKSQKVLIAYDTNEVPGRADARALGRAARHDLRSLGEDTDATAKDLAEQMLSDLSDSDKVD